MRWAPTAPQDFVAWQHMAGQRLHSTAAATSATPGPAPAVPAGWAHAWDVTAPCPAAEQKALQDPRLEGERVLHDLDTLTPGDALDSLAALGVAAAHALLGASGGATLTPVADLCQRFHRCGPLLRAGFDAAPAPRPGREAAPGQSCLVSVPPGCAGWRRASSAPAAGPRPPRWRRAAWRPAPPGCRRRQGCWRASRTTSSSTCWTNCSTSRRYVLVCVLGIWSRRCDARCRQP